VRGLRSLFSPEDMSASSDAVLIGGDEAALKILRELQSIGVRVALDDLGKGYSSLSYPRRFPFDKNRNR
jgi:EAL domain-containing protein (putative c-di-GMP-specific phosphodiesterase class I)